MRRGNAALAASTLSDYAAATEGSSGDQAFRFTPRRSLRPLSVLPEIAEPIGAHLGVAHRVLNILVPEVVL